MASEILLVCTIALPCLDTFRRLGGTRATMWQKLQHCAYVFYMLWFHSCAIVDLGKSVVASFSGRGDEFFESLRIEAGILPVVLAWPAWFTAQIVGAMSCLLGVSMQRCRPSSVRVLLKFWPFIVMNDAYWMFLHLRRLPDDHGLGPLAFFALSQVFYFVFFGWIYFFMIRFYSSDRSAVLFRPGESADVAGTSCQE